MLFKIYCIIFWWLQKLRFYLKIRIMHDWLGKPSSNSSIHYVLFEYCWISSPANNVVIQTAENIFNFWQTRQRISINSWLRKRRRCKCAWWVNGNSASIRNVFQLWCCMSISLCYLLGQQYVWSESWYYKESIIVKKRVLFQEVRNWIMVLSFKWDNNIVDYNKFWYAVDWILRIRGSL